MPPRGPEDAPEEVLERLDAIDRLLEHRVRLAIAVLLSRYDRLSFSRLKELTAETDPVIAGSPRARNLGAIAGGAAAGALIGKAVGGDGKDAAAGAIIGGAAATAGVAASKGYQVVLKNGTELVFTVK